MFTGIIESMGEVASIKKEGTNLRLTIVSSFANELKIDQSVSHNGVCLTVVSISGNNYEVVAIEETLNRSNLSSVVEGDIINLERCMKINDRLDGHIVQGHVDTTAKVETIVSMDGSWMINFTYEGSKYVTVEKGSVCVNGVSLTVVNSNQNFFSVAVIPYTFQNTNFNKLKSGDMVNVEFDIIGKYVQKLIG